MSLEALKLKLTGPRGAVMPRLNERKTIGI
jgi:hypothetical protein